MNIKLFLLTIMMGLSPSLLYAQTLDPALQWKFNGYNTSGIINNGLVTNPNTRTFGDRIKDIPDPNDYIQTWDGSDTFKTDFENYFSKSGNTISILPCGSAFNVPDNYGYSDIGNVTGKFFLDVCSAKRVNQIYYNYVDFGLGDNNPTISSINGGILINRTNTTSVSNLGIVNINENQVTTNPVAQWSGGIDPDMPTFMVTHTMKEYGENGGDVYGSPLAAQFVTENYSHRNWAVQAQGFKSACRNHRLGGSCWGYSTNINDISGRSSQGWNLINENDSQSNGPENASAFYNPKLSNRQMDYASAIAYVPGGWAANTVYNAYENTPNKDPDKVIVNDTNGTAKVLIATVSGTSGTSTLTIPASAAEGSTITDGTVTWTIGTTRDTTIGVVHWINRDDDGSYSSMASYNFGFSGNAMMNNSMFDASHALFGPKAAAFRMAPDTIFSLCDSRTATSDSDINQCTLSYASFYGEFVYTSHGKQIFIAGNDGTFNVPGNIITGDAHINSSLYLGVMSKASILALSSPKEGQKVFDSDDHEELTYVCPSGTNCGWYPVQYGNIIQ